MFEQVMSGIAYLNEEELESVRKYIVMRQQSKEIQEALVARIQPKTTEYVHRETDL